MFFTNLRLVQKIVIPVAISLIVSLGLLAGIIQSRTAAALSDSSYSEVRAIAEANSNDVRATIEVALDETAAVAHGLGNLLNRQVLISREALTVILEGFILENSLLLGGGIITIENVDGQDAQYANKAPYGESGRLAYYGAQNGKRLGLTHIADGSTRPTYLRPQETGHRFISNPLKSIVDGKERSVLTVSVPIMAQGKFQGVVFTDITLENIGKMVNAIKIYKTGYGALLTQDGTVVSFNNPDFVGQKIYSVVQLPDPSALQKAMAEGVAYGEFRKSVGGEPIYCYYCPIEFGKTNQVWYFMVAVPVAEVLEQADAISILTLSVSGVVLVLGLIILIARSTARPIEYLAGVAREIAAGNLNIQINDDRFGGEVRDLSTSFKNMIASLLENIAKAESMSSSAREQAEKAQEAMVAAEASSKDAATKRDNMLEAADRLEEVANIVSSASAELSAQIEQSERGAAEQAARVAETATAMEEMNGTVLEVARNAGAASDVSAQTRKKAEEGASIVHDVVESINAVQEQSLILKDDMAALGAHTQSISQIMSVISDIADQTNLLALNAAIEAARAGDAGRGFAVVADEVRKLAEKTMLSTTDVGKAIKSIQDSAEKSIQQVELAVKNIDAVTSLATRSGNSLNEIVDMVDTNADQVRAIATASEQQSSSSEEINRSIVQVNSIASETARAMQEAARAVSDLTNQSQVLTQLIDNMKNS